MNCFYKCHVCKKIWSREPNVFDTLGKSQEETDHTMFTAMTICVDCNKKKAKEGNE